MQVFETTFQHLLEQQIISPSQVIEPRQMPTFEQLLLVHDQLYIEQFLRSSLPEHVERRIGFRQDVRNAVLIERTLWELAGTLLAVDMALEYGLACSTAGGTHHALRETGAGFCIINDLAITSELLLSNDNRVNCVLCLDLDVHQGDGTAALLQGRQGAVTVSLHAEKNFPARKQESTIDVSLPDNLGDGEYLRILADLLPTLIHNFKPDICLYDAGVDVHKDDELGRLALTTRGIHSRDHLVLNTFFKAGIPVVGLVGGGYHRDLKQLAQWHACLHRAASCVWHADLP